MCPTSLSSASGNAAKKRIKITLLCFHDHVRGVSLHATVHSSLGSHSSIGCRYREHLEIIGSYPERDVWKDSGLPQDATDLLRKLVCLDRNQRITAEEALRVNHPPLGCTKTGTAERHRVQT